MRADGWSDVKLRELVVAGGLQTGPFGGQLHADEYVADGVPVVMPQDIISGEISTEHIARVSEEKAASLAQHRLRTGDLVFARRGDIGRVGIARDRETGWLCGTGCLRARPSERVSPVYLHYAVRRASSIAWLNIHAVGQTMLNLNTSILGQLPADVPPLPEQRAIAAVLDTINDAIQKTEQIIAKLQQVKQGLLHDLLTRGIDDNGELRDPERHPEQFQDSPLGRIPKGWGVRSLEDCTRTDAPITYGIVQAGPHIEGGVPYIRTGDMAGDELVREGMLCTSPRIAASFARSRVEAGDIVCAIRATVGKVLPVSQQLEGANLTQGTARIAPARDIHPSFLLWALRGFCTKRQFDLYTKGTTFSEITLTQLRKLLVAVPLNGDEQVRVAQIMESWFWRLARERENHVKLIACRAGLSDDLLTGRVRTTSLPGVAA